MGTDDFSKGLHELAEGLWAYLQPSGTWGYSNAGLVSGDDDSLLVDTLFDLNLTRDMLDEMKPITRARPIGALVNTHANGDHCFGNELVPDRATIYATVATAHEMKEVPAGNLAALKTGPDAEIREFANYAFGDFDLDAVNGRAPDETFERELRLSLGGREVHVRDLGPAHTRSDSIVIVPAAGVVFTGDLVFVKGTPIAWAGPIGNWTSACDAICALDVETVVPGHGPITDKEGVRRVKAYFEFVHSEAEKRHAAGMDSVEAAFDIDLGEFGDLSDPERIVVTVDTAYREFDPSHTTSDAMTLFREMGRYHKNRLHQRTEN
jgi:cyclase